jgi:hypothetical protein
MLSYLFLLAAAASAQELPTTDVTPTEQQELQELVANLTVETDEAAAQPTVVAANVAEQPATAPEVAASPIVVTNAIEPKMLEYKHWTGKYSPEKFSISVNGAEIAQGSTYEIPANSSTVEIGYTYSFMNGMKSGGRKISYQLNENITQLNITFDWKNDWRVIVDNGKAVKEVSA